MSDSDALLTFSETSPFVRLLSNPSRVKIADVFLRRPNSVLIAGEITELAGISESTFSRNKDVFLEMEFLQTRERGGQRVYQLNTENETVQKFGEAHTQLLVDAEAIFEESGRQEMSIEDVIRATAADDRDDHDRNTESERVARVVGATA